MRLSACLTIIEAADNIKNYLYDVLDDWLQAESEVTQQKAKTVIAQNLILKERKRPGLNGVTGASFEQPASGPLG